MKLMTKTLEAKIPEMGQFENDENPTIIAHYFNPIGQGDWYVIEGEKDETNNWMFYGLVDLHFREYGYFSLKELENIKLPYGMGIERELYWNPITIKELESRG